MISKILKDKNTLLYGKLFIVSIAVHWIIMFLGFFVFKQIEDPGSGFFAFFYEKFVVAGDTPHYINIAKNGYAAVGETANQIVFYPLYPFLMKIFGFIFKDYFITGVFVSNVCLGISAIYMYKLCNRELGENAAKDGFIIYLLYPLEAFLISVYTESLFIMLTLMCLYYIRENKWLIAGITGLLAALSKSQGIALFVPAVYEAVVYMVRNKRFYVKSLLVCLIPCGTGIYLLINKIVQGDFMAFVAHQAAEPWYNVSHWISSNLSQHYGMATDEGLFYLAIIIYWAQIILYFVGMVALFYGIKKKIAPSIIAFGGAYMFLSYLHGWLISGPRYMLSCVTLYIIYAAIDNKIVKQVIFVIFGLLCVFCTLLMWRGDPIM
ncbi:MAG: hypothetical protein E7267_04935 [Lachnospiraceae bacterium]|nr:hypothetical protein [Lachnospiraceae bacterium]